MFLGSLQFGFRPGHSTQDIIYVLSTLIQKCKDSKLPYNAMFIDISKVVVYILNYFRTVVQAYDSITRKSLYQKLKQLGFGGRVLSIIRSMYHV